MPPAPEATNHDRLFAEVVSATIDRLEALVRALDEERQALAGQDAEALHTVVRHKLETLAALERVVVTRDQLQDAVGLAPGLDGGEGFVASRTPELAADWQRLLQLCRQVDQANAANGQLALQSARQAREALSILTGRDRAPTLYGPGRRQENAVVSGHSFGRV